MTKFDLTPYVPWIWFSFFGLFTLVMALGVVFHRKIVYNAVFLALSLVGTGALYITLNADFLGIVQILLYVGGIIVLILFSILLTRGEERGVEYVNRNKQSFWAFSSIMGLSLWIGIQFWKVQWPDANRNLAANHWERYSEIATIKTLPQILNRTVPVEAIGDGLMKPYLLIFELASIVLLVAMVGVVIYMKPEKKGDADA